MKWGRKVTPYPCGSVSASPLRTAIAFIGPWSAPFRPHPLLSPITTALTATALFHPNTTHRRHFSTGGLAIYQEWAPATFHLPTAGPTPAVPHFASASHSPMPSCLSVPMPTLSSKPTSRIPPSACKHVLVSSILINKSNKKHCPAWGPLDQVSFHFISFHVKLWLPEGGAHAWCLDSVNFNSLNMPPPAASPPPYPLYKDIQWEPHWNLQWKENQ